MWVTVFMVLAISGFAAAVLGYWNEAQKNVQLVNEILRLQDVNNTLREELIKLRSGGQSNRTMWNEPTERKG